jgi:hypothetical protein
MIFHIVHARTETAVIPTSFIRKAFFPPTKLPAKRLATGEKMGSTSAMTKEVVARKSSSQSDDETKALVSSTLYI